MAGTYPRPPWPFRGAQQIAVVFDARADGLTALIPPGLVIDTDERGEVRCEIRVCWYPWSAYGPFHETYALIRVRHGEELLWFLPLIMTDNDIPLSTGREVWGYAKKLAVMSWEWGAHTAGQVLFTMDRPRGQRLLTVTFAPARLAQPTERVGYHVISHRHLTGPNSGLSELVRLGGSKAVRSGADGTRELWYGAAGLTLPSASAHDPWHLFRPRRIHGAFLQVSDFALAPGEVLADVDIPRP